MFYLLRLLEEAKKLQYFTIFQSASYIYQRMPMGLNITPQFGSHI